MTNHYEAAEIFELGAANELVLGNKQPAAQVDSLTQLFGSRVIDSQDDE